MPLPSQRQSRLDAKGPAPLRPDLDAALWKHHGIKPSNETQIAKLVERLAKDPELYIFGGFARTFDEQAEPEQRVKPFPDKEYLRRTLRFMHDPDPDHPVRAGCKSRQLMWTWLASGYATWEARFHDFSRVMIQSRKAEDAWKLVYKGDWIHSRCGFIERAMPMELRSNGIIGTQGALSYPNGSEIWGIPQGPHMARSYTATLFICDEAAFQPEFEEAYTAVLPMAKKVVVISTALGGSFYGDLIEQNDTADEDAA